MKNLTSVIVIILLMAGCGGEKQSTDELIAVDVMQKPTPKKDLILQDFMDVEYIALETNDEFINQGFVQAIGKEFIVVRNFNDDGDIFVYDRTGKAIRKINRKGQGGEEYTGIYNIILDEDKNEMFVNDIFAKKVVVYDLFGNFKRSFKSKEGGGSVFYTDIFNYDKDNLICYDAYNESIAFLLVSKQDGSITKEIKTPFKEKIFLRQQLNDDNNDMIYTVSPGPTRSIIPSHDGNWILFELSSDTVYTFLPDYNLRPLMVRTPSIQSMDPGVFLILRLFSARYCFMETIKNVYDFKDESGFPKTYFMYDKQENKFLRYIIYNGDYSTKEEMYMSMTRPVNHEIESWYPIQAHKLFHANKRGELKGKLKEMAENIDEESNPVIMLIKHKK